MTPPTPPPTSDGRGERLGALIKDAVDDVLQWREAAAHTDDEDVLTSGWPESDYDEIAANVIAALTMEPDELARLRRIEAAAQRLFSVAPGIKFETAGLLGDLAAALTTATPEPTDVPDEREG